MPAPDTSTPPTESAGGWRRRVLSIAPHVAFVDALAQGLLDRFGGDPLRLARTQVLLPNRRATRALTDAFVRLSGNGLLLPRMTPVGDLDDSGFDRLAGGGAPLAPMVRPLLRRLELARLVRALPGAGNGRSAVEALRLGDQLGATLDVLLAEEIPPAALKTAVDAADLASHWQQTLEFLDVVITAWPPARDATGCSDGGTRIAALIDGLVARWRQAPPAHPVIAAGITGSSPPLVRLLGAVAALPHGMVVLPGLDTDASPAGDARWQAIGLGDDGVRASEEHPQHALKALLHRLGLDRADVDDWGVATASDGPATRTRAIMAAMAPAAAADSQPPPPPDAFASVRAVEAATPAEEAQVIALAMRQALLTPGRSAALVTPDRGLARRVAAQCRRWGLNVDDSAGTPLRISPPGALAQALVEAMAQGFAPVALLAVMKHPLVASGDARGTWLVAARQLDMALRGVRPPRGLDGVGEALDRWQSDRHERLRLRPDPARATALETADAAQRDWWEGAASMLEPLARLGSQRSASLPALAAALRLAGSALCGDRLWSGTDGRALARLIDALEEDGAAFGSFDHDDAPALFAALLSDVAIRAPYSGHPRLAILGPLEAQLQRADLMILGGLNESVWPARPAPDPWLAPAIRARLGLSGLARATGLAAHDFVGGMGAASVLLTRARRDASAPLVPSRFWRRVQGFSGGIAADHDLLRWARAIDGRGQPQPCPPPRPCPPVDRRPRSLSVTEVDTLIADPFAFYARNMLRLRRLDPLDDDPSAASRGNRIHAVMDRWTGHGRASLDLLERLAEEEIGAEARHFPLLRALWAPRARRALAWAGQAVHDREAAGWLQMVGEAAGEMALPNGITLRGRADRVDRNTAGELAIIDYKTGRVPSLTQVLAGFANQLGLLMAMAARGHLKGVAAGTPLELAYWQLGGGREPGKIVPALGKKSPPPVATHVDEVLRRAEERTTALLLTATNFEAKLYPGLAWSDFDHLARVAEWLDRPRRDGAAR